MAGGTATHAPPHVPHTKACVRLAAQAGRAQAAAPHVALLGAGHVCVRINCVDGGL